MYKYLAVWVRILSMLLLLLFIKNDFQGRESFTCDNDKRPIWHLHDLVLCFLKHTSWGWTFLADYPYYKFSADIYNVSIYHH